MSAATSVGQQAWKTYQEIESVVAKRYRLSEPSGWIGHSDVSKALQRLGEAVLLRYNLKDKELIFKKWNIKLETGSIKKLPLSTIKEMVSAKISEWEDEIPSTPDYQIAHDSWADGYPGRTAAYRQQPSLQEVLDLNYSELEAIANTTPAQAWKIFEQIQIVAQAEIDRLAPSSITQGLSKDKAIEIANAIERLRQAVLYKYNLKASDNSSPTPQIEKKHVDLIDLYSFDTMLDAECKEWESNIMPFEEPKFCMGREEGYKPRKSVRQALNLATGNLFSVFGLLPPLWGKTTALQNVEEKLYSTH